MLTFQKILIKKITLCFGSLNVCFIRSLMLFDVVR
jgi:hypothetical protein